MHSTNYIDTFIEIAEDSALMLAKIPMAKNENPTIAGMQYARLNGNPYHWTSDDLLFDIYAERQGIEPSRENRDVFFSKGQACLRCSPLAKSHGFGFHFDERGGVAIYGVETDEYALWLNDPNVLHVQAMRSKRA